MNSFSLFRNNLLLFNINKLSVTSVKYCHAKGCLGISTINNTFKRYYCQNTSGLLSLCDRQNNYCFKKRKMSLLPSFKNLQKFKLNDYDCIGFDLDNTLCEYKIEPMVLMEYDVLSKFLVERKGYDPKFLLSPLSSDDVDFLQRGLVLDFDRGNILKLDENGAILKASHGTKVLTESDIKSLYGESFKFNYADNLCKDLTCAWDEEMKSKFRLLLDYFDLPASLVFARAVDSLNDQGDCNFSSVGKDVLSGLIHMYARDNFSSENSAYFKELKANPNKYINKCSNDLVNWLKEIGQSKVLFLVTGSNVDYASFTASYCLGEDWLDIFDVVVCYARKPGFFSLRRPFLEVSGLKECGELPSKELKLNNIYSQGNWSDLETLLKEAVPSKKPNLLYIGDNIVEDIYTPHRHALCDTLAISEELSAEKIWSCEEQHPSADCIASKKWGSFFIDDDANKLTLWGSVIGRCSKLCLPSVSALAKVPLNESIEPSDIVTTKLSKVIIK